MGALWGNSCVHWEGGRVGGWGWGGHGVILGALKGGLLADLKRCKHWVFESHVHPADAEADAM